MKTVDESSFSEMVAKSVRMVQQKHMAQQGERIVLTAGVPFGTPGSTNIIRLAEVTGESDEFRGADA